MSGLTQAEIDAFAGLNDSYVEMHRKMSETAPRCHFKTMSFEEAEGESWWECNYCGHTKHTGFCDYPR